MKIVANILIKSVIITILAVLVILISDIVAVEIIGFPQLTSLLQVVICIGMILFIVRGKLPYYGLKKSHSVSYLIMFLLVLIIHALIRLSILIFGLTEGAHPLLDNDLSFIIIQGLILAPITEELIFRGLVQSYLSPFKQTGFRIIKIFFSYPVLFAALLFSLSHLPMVLRSTGIIAGLPILIGSLFYGILFGFIREKYDSLIPAVIAHFIANLLALLTPLIIS